MRAKRLMTLISPRTVNPRDIGTGGRPEWTAEDAALACARLDPVPAAAIRYRWARDETVRPTLYGALMAFAAKVAVRESWHETVLSVDGERIRYLHKLVELALLEEHAGFEIRSRNLYAEMMDVTHRTWIKRLSPRYEQIRGRLDVWCGIAEDHINRRLRKK